MRRRRRGGEEEKKCRRRENKRIREKEAKKRAFNRSIKIYNRVTLFFTTLILTMMPSFSFSTSFLLMSILTEE